MKDSYDIQKSYSYSHSEQAGDDFFSSDHLNEIENDISHLQTYSDLEHRKLGRTIYSKISKQLLNVKDEKQISRLKRLAHLINMKIAIL